MAHTFLSILETGNFSNMQLGVGPYGFSICPDSELLQGQVELACIFFPEVIFIDYGVKYSKMHGRQVLLAKLFIAKVCAEIYLVHP